jgi:hypothetical protein
MMSTMSLITKGIDRNSMRYAIYADKLVDAREEVSSSPRLYHCVLCAEPHEVTLVKAKDKRYFEPAWFRHKADNFTPHSHGESNIHFKAKYLLQSKKGQYFFDVFRCNTCPNMTRVVTNEGEVKIEKQVGVYRCDAILYGAILQQRIFARNENMCVKENQTDAVLEVYHTHKTEDDKKSSLRDRGMIFAEFEAKHVIDKLSTISSHSNLVQLQNIACQHQKCDVCFMYNCHDIHMMCLVENSWETFHIQNGIQIYEQLCDEKRLRKKRRAQSEAFEDARQQELRNKKPRKKALYIKGLMRKCPECQQWEHVNGMKGIRYERAPQWFCDNKYYYNQKLIHVCNNCCVLCRSCDKLQPLSNALRYGLCFKCNTKPLSIWDSDDSE